MTRITPSPSRTKLSVMLGLSRPNPPLPRPGALPEITEPTDLCWPDGRLRPDAIGWSRRPLHRARLRGRGRNKRWEYWGVMSPDVFVGVTVSDLDYAALHAVYLLTRDGVEARSSALMPFSRVPFSAEYGDAPLRVHHKSLAITIEPRSGGVELGVSSKAFDARITIDRPPGHECLAVVVPWSPRRFQYTVKENTLPARGWVEARGRRWDLDNDAWATLDHGRGRWPYRITWNWGSGSGRVDGRIIGIQVGGAWTDGTGSTENAITIDGVVSYIGSDLVWEYDRRDWMRPWRVVDRRSGRLDLTFTPEAIRSESINAGVLANDTHQAFGTWSGTIYDASFEPMTFSGIRGWAEEVRNRW